MSPFSNSVHTTTEVAHSPLACAHARAGGNNESNESERGVLSSSERLHKGTGEHERRDHRRSWRNAGARLNRATATRVRARDTSRCRLAPRSATNGALCVSVRKSRALLISL